MNKTKYVVHYKNLELYRKLGIKVKKVDRIIEFNEKPWMEPYIRLNTELRKKPHLILKKTFSNL